MEKRKSPQGTSTTNLTVSAYVAGNAEVFTKVLQLHVAPRSKIADVTYGKGVFWRNIPRSKYHILGTDIQTGTDCCALPYNDDSIDCVVLDPRSMDGLYRSAKTNFSASGYFGA